MKEYIKSCVMCNKKFKATRRHAETCSESCRSQKCANKKVEKTLRPEITEQIELKYLAEMQEEQALGINRNCDLQGMMYWFWYSAAGGKDAVQWYNKNIFRDREKAILAAKQWYEECGCSIGDFEYDRQGFIESGRGGLRRKELDFSKTGGRVPYKK